MAYARFDRPVFLQRKHFIEEIAGLDDVFDILEEWPADQRGLQFEILEDACRRAVRGCFPVEAVRENFRRFLKKSGMLAEIEDVPDLGRVMNDRNIGGV